MPSSSARVTGRASDITEQGEVAEESSDGGNNCSRGGERDGRARCEHRVVDVAISTRSNDGDEAGESLRVRQQREQELACARLG